jgi:hypothetical protein
VTEVEQRCTDLAMLPESLLVSAHLLSPYLVARTFPSPPAGCGGHAGACLVAIGRASRGQLTSAGLRTISSVIACAFPSERRAVRPTPLMRKSRISFSTSNRASPFLSFLTDTGSFPPTCECISLVYELQVSRKTRHYAYSCMYESPAWVFHVYRHLIYALPNNVQATTMAHKLTDGFKLK